MPCTLLRGDYIMKTGGVKQPADDYSGVGAALVAALAPGNHKGCPYKIRIIMSPYYPNGSCLESRTSQDDPFEE